MLCLHYCNHCLTDHSCGYQLVYTAKPPFVHPSMRVHTQGKSEVTGCPKSHTLHTKFLKTQSTILSDKTIKYPSAQDHSFEQCLFIPQLCDRCLSKKNSHWSLQTHRQTKTSSFEPTHISSENANKPLQELLPSTDVLA